MVFLNSIIWGQLWLVIVWRYYWGHMTHDGHFFLLLLHWSTLWHLQKLLQYIKYIIIEIIPSIVLLDPPPSIHRIISTGLIFPFTYMCTQYFYHINPPYHFLTSSPLPLVPTPQKRLQFCFKKVTFLFNIFAYLRYTEIMMTFIYLDLGIYSWQSSFLWVVPVQVVSPLTSSTQVSLHDGGVVPSTSTIEYC
jgi:hypothetical protein